MNIKCPNCKTAYVIPEAKIEDKPKKMRCSRCKEVFTVTRRSRKAPVGYQEFTGRQNALPSEFAFLRPSSAAPPHSTDDERISVLDTEAERPPVAASPPPVPRKFAVETTAATEAVATSSSYEDFTPVLNFDDERTHPGLMQSAKVPAVDTPKPVVVKETLPGTPPPAAHPNATGSKATPAGLEVAFNNSWETEAPLELGDYAASSAHSQRIGKYIALVWAVLFLFFFFVIIRNGWSLSLSNLSDQIAFAFFVGDQETLPDAVDGLDAVVSERRVLDRVGLQPLLVVEGTIYNNASIQRNSIMLRGRLFDGNGDSKGEIRLPCDKTFSDSALKETKAGQLQALFRDGAELHKCSIAADAGKPFQIVFEDIPRDYDNTYVVEIKPVYAE